MLAMWNLRKAETLVREVVNGDTSYQDKFIFVSLMLGVIGSLEALAEGTPRVDYAMLKGLCLNYYRVIIQVPDLGNEQ